MQHHTTLVGTNNYPLNQLTRMGRFLYGIGIAAIGIHQFIIKDFRPDILPPFPAWAHQYIAFPLLAGAALVFAGTVIAGLLKIKIASPRRVSLYLGFCFLVLIITCYLPYILIFSPDTAARLDVWFGVGEALAYSGGAFVIAGSYSDNNLTPRKNSFELFMERFISSGRIFFAILIILFGCSHFIFAEFVSKMVPAWIGFRMFLTYFVGVALVGSGVAIIFRIWIKPVALLLAMMLFLFFLFFHIPDAIANPSVGGGNEIVRAIVALLFCGIALVIATTNRQDSLSSD